MWGREVQKLFGQCPNAFYANCNGVSLIDRILTPIFIFTFDRKPKKQPPELFSFMHPLSLDVWIYIVVAYFIVSFLLFILARYKILLYVLFFFLLF